MARRSKRTSMGRNAIVPANVDRSSVRQSPATWLSIDRMLGLILAAAVFLIYTPTCLAGFQWDDDMHLTENPCIIGPHGLADIWTSAQADICPLTLTTFWVEHKLWGLVPLPYHLVNVLFHAACAVVLWRVLRVLEIPGAWLGAALWAVHPLQVESVAWITEMKNTESGFFFLLSVLFYVKDFKAENARFWNPNYTIMLVFAACAMASKTSTVVLPAALCLAV